MLIKSASDIKTLERGGRILGTILSDLMNLCQAGVSTLAIDRRAEEMIHDAGGRPAFKYYKNHPTESPFPSTICASLNNEVVHGIARPDVVLKNGDIFKIDIGMEWPYDDAKKRRGLYTDTAVTVAIGKIDKKTHQLMQVTHDCLEAGLEAIKPGVSLASIGGAIEQYVKSQGKYGIVRDLSGHGVGHAVHEDPWIPNYYEKQLEKFILKPGMVLAIEPMLTLGGWRIKSSSDGWTILTADGSLSAHFEHTAVVTAKGCKVVTRRPEEI
jgi:methionyl aminopeptidase